MLTIRRKHIGEIIANVVKEILITRNIITLGLFNLVVEKMQLCHTHSNKAKLGSHFSLIVNKLWQIRTILYESVIITTLNIIVPGYSSDHPILCENVTILYLKKKQFFL